MNVTDSKLKQIVDNNYSIIRSYVRTVACDSFWVGDGEREGKVFYDPFESDQNRVILHNTIAAVFSIPRLLVSHCRETIKDVNGGTTNLYHFYNSICWRKDALDRTVDRFIDRIVKAWHEFHELGMYKDMVAWIADVAWVEKAANEINSIRGLPNMCEEGGNDGK